MTAVLFGLPPAELGATDKQAYGEAMAVYNAKQYEKAYGAFKDLFFEDMSDPKVNFYLGRSAYESGKYNDAVAAYERVLISNPDHMKARVELARTYFVMRLYEQSEIEFTTILLQPIPEGVRKTISDYMKKIEDAKEKHMLNGMFTLIAQDDSNINNGNTITNKPGRTPVSDRSLAAYLAMIHTYKLSERDTYWVTRANIYSQKYAVHEDSNVEYPFVETGWQIKKKDYAFSVLGGFEALNYGGESTFTGKSIAGLYERQLTKSEVISGKVKLADTIYTKDEGRNSNSYELDVKWQQIQPNGNIYSLFGNHKMEREKKDLRPTNDVSADYTRLGGGYYTKISPQNALNFNYYLKLRQHLEADESGLDDGTRRDTSHTVGASLITSVDKRSYLSFFVNYTDNSSTHDNYTYNKTIAGVSYSINLDNDWLRNHPDWEEK